MGGYEINVDNRGCMMKGHRMITIAHQEHFLLR